MVEALEPWGDVTWRAMWGGYACYRAGLLFAFIDEGRVQLKTIVERDSRGRQKRVHYEDVAEGLLADDAAFQRLAERYLERLR